MARSSAAAVVALGTITLGGSIFAVDREGQVEAGKETTFGVELVGGPQATPSRAWLANPDGSEVCEPVGGEGHEQHFHFTLDPLEPVKRSRFMLRVGNNDGSLDFARGEAPCNDGILTVVRAAGRPEWRGYMELKLHGDAGDLELWLYRQTTSHLFGAPGGKPTPLDVPPDTVVTLTFTSHGRRSVELRVRNAEQNEDEEGAPNMRPSGTNYFIFPGESGQDPAWLADEQFRGVVSAAFEAEGEAYACEPFVLVPHEALH